MFKVIANKKRPRLVYREKKLQIYVQVWVEDTSDHEIFKAEVPLQMAHKYPKGEDLSKCDASFPLMAGN